MKGHPTSKRGEKKKIATQAGSSSAKAQARSTKAAVAAQCSSPATGAMPVAAPSRKIRRKSLPQQSPRRGNETKLKRPEESLTSQSPRKRQRLVTSLKRPRNKQSRAETSKSGKSWEQFPVIYHSKLSRRRGNFIGCLVMLCMSREVRMSLNFGVQVLHDS